MIELTDFVSFGWVAFWRAVFKSLPKIIILKICWTFNDYSWSCIMQILA